MLLSPLYTLKGVRRSFQLCFRFASPWQRRQSCFCSLSTVATQEKIRKITELTTTPLVPELLLHLITPKCSLWSSQPEACPFKDPFWAFFWPGGQALCRYILDNPYICKSKRILDIGSGGGSTVIAALKSGSENVVANDIDSTAISVTNLNIKENFELSMINEVKRKLVFCQDDILPHNEKGTDQQLGPYFQMLHKIPSLWKQSPILNQTFDVILVGDLFYDDEIALRLLTLLQALREFYPLTSIYIGDPGRHAFLKHFSRLPIIQVAEYDLPETVVDENYGFPSVSVYHLT